MNNKNKNYKSIAQRSSSIKLKNNDIKNNIK